MSQWDKGFVIGFTIGAGMMTLFWYLSVTL